MDGGLISATRSIMSGRSFGPRRALSIGFPGHLGSGYLTDGYRRKSQASGGAFEPREVGFLEASQESPSTRSLRCVAGSRTLPFPHKLRLTVPLMFAKWRTL